MWLFGHKKKKTEAEAILPEVKPPQHTKNVLLVVDGSQQSLDALSYGLGLARAMDALLLAVYVVDTAMMDYLIQMRVILPEERDEFRQEMEKKGHRYLENARLTAGLESVGIETKLVTGRFDSEIVGMVKERDVNLVIMGGWKQSVHSQDASTKARQLLLDQVECPVAIIK
ncbi:MAG: universal stress protein [Lentisphaerae bacterium]|jgi:nucleotide-binding universal stress UspA family protein|nr:universal stress protein [Lentisphaerota bacterium]